MELYSHYSGKLGLICFAIWVIMLIRGRKVFTGNTIWSNNYWFVFLGMLLFSVLGFLEWDSYHYFSIYEQTKQSGFRVHFEPFYGWLIKTLPDSYLLFRFVVWGMASLFMALSFKRLKLNASVLAMTVPILFLSQLANTRGSSALALMIYSSIVFVQSIDKRKIIPCLFAIGGLVASSFLHRSAAIFVVFLVIAYFLPLNKRIFIISLIVFPILYGSIYLIFQDFSSFEYLNEEQISLINDYQAEEHRSGNINGLIMEVFSSVMLLLLIFNISHKYLFKRIDTSKAMSFLYRYAYVMVYVSFLFLREDVSNWVSVRVLHAGTFALVCCATQCFDSQSIGIKRRPIEMVIILGYLAISFWRHFTFITSYWGQ